MKSFLALALTAAVTSTAPAASLIAFWDFNNGFAVANNTVQIVHAASAGSGTIYQQRADTDGNGKGGITFTDSGLGIDATAGSAMAWDDVAKDGENDAEFFVVFSTTGYKDIFISFDLQGNDNAGIISYDVKYSTNPLEDVINPTDVAGTVKDFQGGVSTALLDDQSAGANSTFTRITLDFTTLGATAINNQGFVAIRFDDWESNNAMRIDNLLVYGTVVPEPGSAILGALGSLALLRRRR